MSDYSIKYLKLNNGFKGFFAFIYKHIAIFESFISYLKNRSIVAFDPALPIFRNVWKMFHPL